MDGLWSMKLEVDEILFTVITAGSCPALMAWAAKDWSLHDPGHASAQPFLES